MRDAFNLAKVSLSKSIAIGPQATALEEQLMNLTNSGYCTSFSSGTAGLHAAYNSIPNIRESEVITSPLSFIATASTALFCGASIKFVDIDVDTGLMDIAKVDSAISRKTSVVTVVDYAGIPFDVPSLRMKLKDQVEYIIQDAAHSFGSKFNNEYIGNLADMTVFSFFPTKNIAAGEAGAITSNNVDLYNKFNKFKSHGITRNLVDLVHQNEGGWHQESQSLGLNYRLSELHSALALSQLNRLEKFKKRRQEIFQKYIANLKDLTDISLPNFPIDTEPMWHLFPLRVPSNKRKELFNHLRSKNILVQVNYLPIYLHPIFADLGYRRGVCPNAEQYYSQEISLPMHYNLKNWQIDYVSELILKFFK